MCRRNIYDYTILFLTLVVIRYSELKYKFLHSYYFEGRTLKLFNLVIIRKYPLKKEKSRFLQPVAVYPLN